MPDRAALTAQLEAPIEAPGVTGNAPGGSSRWQTGRSTEWHPLRAKLVAEVRFDHVTAQRFRHGAAFLRWCPDTTPGQCILDRLGEEPPGDRRCCAEYRLSGRNPSPPGALSAVPMI